jgi:hypothetical protein
MFSGIVLANGSMSPNFGGQYYKARLAEQFARGSKLGKIIPCSISRFTA